MLICCAKYDPKWGTALNADFLLKVLILLSINIKTMAGTALFSEN